MKANPFRTLILLTVTTVAAVVLSGPRLQAEEPARLFLDALRQRGYFELANEYLLDAEKNPAIGAEFRETILYEQGLILTAMSRGETDFDARQKLLDDAQAKFKQFLTAHANHDLSSKAENEMANVLVERARVKVAEANRAKNESRKPELMKQAREYYDQAEKAFAKSQENIAAKLKSFPKQLDEKKDAKRIALRDELRADYIKVQMVQAVILYEKAETALNDKDKKELLTAAAKKYGEIYDKYRRRLAGLYARLSQGRCHQDIGTKESLTEALTVYQDLLEQPETPDLFRTLRTKTLIQAEQCWIHEEIKQFDKAIELGMAWLSKRRPNERRDPEWLELSYYVAQAHAGKIKTLNEKAPERAPLLKEAKQIVENGIKLTSGDLKTKFQTLNTELGGKGPSQEKVEPKTFAEAMKAGSDAMGVISGLNTRVGILTDQANKTKDDAEKTKINEEIAETKQEMIDTRYDAIKYFRQALTMVEPETSLEDINNARYYLCYLYYTDSNYYNAAIMGEFVTRRFPGSRGGTDCANIAYASYLRMYQENPAESDDAKQFEISKVIDIADYINTQWPGSKEADGALLTLIKFMVRQKNIEGAQKYLAQIPADSPQRGEAELATGQAMWSAYIRGNREIKDWKNGEAQPPEGVTIASREAELDKLKETAESTLKNGVDRMKAKGIDQTLTAAVMSLIQIYVDTAQASKAIALLEDEEIGALTLVEKKNPAVQRAGYDEEAYRTGLRAYIGALPGAKDKAALMAKADQMMDKLNGTVGKDAAGKKKLISIYYTLAKEVEGQIEAAPPVARKPLTEGFALFLGRVGETTDQFPILEWVARSFLTLGDNNWDGKGDPPADVKGYYQKSNDIYQKIVDRAENDPAITDKIETGMRLQLARVKRKLNKHLYAMDEYETVLKENQKILDLQLEAAECYQEWGSWGVSKLYRVAITGGRRDAKGKPVVWGYKLIDQRLTQAIAMIRQEQTDAAESGEAIDAEEAQKQNEQLANLTQSLHRAKYNRGECYLKYALRQDDPKVKEEYLQTAKQWIRVTQRAFPDLGGEKYLAKYDKLLRDVQTNMGETPVGLAAFEEEESDDKTAAVSP